MKEHPRTLAIVATVGAGLFAGTSATWADAGHGAAPYGKPGRAADVDRVLELTVDGMSYGIDKLRVRAGETIRFIVRNDTGIEHDFTIGDTETQAAHRAEMMKMMQNADAGMMGHDDANAVFLRPGQTGEIIWTFSKAGRFEFACNVPGHYEAGMRGPIRVVDASG